MSAAHPSLHRVAAAPVNPVPAIRRAVRDITPIAVAVLPFGMVVGVTLGEAGLVGPTALVATMLLYAGSAQLATLTVLLTGGGMLAAVLAGAVVNLRLVLYSASHGARFRDHPAWFRWLAPLTTVDQTFALAAAASDLTGRAFRRYWGTLGVLLGVAWCTAVVLGLRVGSMLPSASPLSVVAPAAIVALLVPHLSDPRMRRTAATAAVATLVGSVLPGGLGIALGIGAALAVAGPSSSEVTP